MPQTLDPVIVDLACKLWESIAERYAAREATQRDLVSEGISLDTVREITSSKGFNYTIKRGSENPFVSSDSKAFMELYEKCSRA